MSHISLNTESYVLLLQYRSAVQVAESFCLLEVEALHLEIICCHGSKFAVIAGSHKGCIFLAVSSASHVQKQKSLLKTPVYSMSLESYESTVKLV
jgi:hypothetical protein